MELIGGSSDRCQSSLLYDDGKGVRTLLLTLIGLRVCTNIVGIALLLTLIGLRVCTNIVGIALLLTLIGLRVCTNIVGIALLLTLIGLRVCTNIVGIAGVFPTSVYCRLDRFYFVNLSVLSSPMVP